MFSLNNLLFGLFLTIIGVIMVKYNFKLVGITGRQDWIENVLGSGTTYLVYQVFAVALTLFGIALATGLGDNVGRLLLNPLRSVFPTAGH